MKTDYFWSFSWVKMAANSIFYHYTKFFNGVSFGKDGIA
jgi:hypothetical protein